MALTDSTLLILLLDQKQEHVLDHKKGIVIDRVQERIEYLIAQLDERKEKLLIPTPVLAEVLIGADSAGPSYLEILQKRSVFRIVSFDARAAIELAMISREARINGNKKGESTKPWAGVKFDRQLVAIAKVERQSVIYSNDDDIRKFCEPLGISVIGIEALPLPPVKAQIDMNFAPPSKSAEENAPSTGSGVAKLSKIASENLDSRIGRMLIPPAGSTALPSTSVDASSLSFTALLKSMNTADFATALSSPALPSPVPARGLAATSQSIQPETAEGSKPVTAPVITPDQTKQ